MNLDPIIQSEVSQKEKEKYCILTHTYRIQKNGTEELFTGQQWRNKDGKQTKGHGEMGEERGRCMERVAWKLTLPYVKQIANGIAVWLRKLKQGLCINLEGWDGEGDGREFQKGGDICIPMANSC